MPLRTENEAANFKATNTAINSSRSVTVRYLPWRPPSMWSEGQLVAILENMKIATSRAKTVCQAVSRPARMRIFEMTSPDTKMCNATRGGFSTAGHSASRNETKTG